MRKGIIIFLPSLLLLAGVMAFTIKAKYRPATAKAARFAATRQKLLSPGCGGRLDYDDITGDIPALPGWGNYSWKVTTASDSAQFYFNQGINMYYGFHIIESMASFKKATRFDSTCAMAWYGRALSLGPTINDDTSMVPSADAWQFAEKSKSLSANCTPFEQSLINAMQVRYSATASANNNALKQQYANAMKAVSATYPKSADAVALYADALMLLHPWDLYDNNLKPKPWTPGIAQVILQALANNPRHPGANHYYIHTMEGSEHPEKALQAAQMLGTLMPGVAHVTHMPSHIYIRTGDYAKGIRVNDSAVAGYNNYLALYSPVADGIGLYKLHNEHLQAACAQMAGNYAIAEKEAKDLQASISPDYLTLPGGFGNVVQYMYETETFIKVRFGKWNDLVAMKTIDTLPYTLAIQHFAKGVAFSRLHSFAEAGAELQSFNTAMQNPLLNASSNNFSSAYKVCFVAKYILEGVLAEEKGMNEQAIAALQKAVIAEDSIVYNEPRDWSLPARQYLGSVLLKTKAFSQAADVFNRELIINPNNGWSLTGLLQAYKGMGKTALAQKTAAKLKTAFALKDVEIEGPVF